MNNENKKFKQINRIATPIKVDEQGKPLDSNINLNNQVNPEMNPSTAKVKKAIPKPKFNIKVKPIVIYRIVTVSLVIGIILLIIPLIEPSKILNRNRLQYNDKLPITKSDEVYPFRETTIASGDYITEITNIHINDDYDLSTINNNQKLDLIINGKRITSADKVLTKIGFIDDLIIIGVENHDIRSTRLYIVDKQGNILEEFYHIGSIDGMTLISGKEAITYNGITAVLKTTNVIDNRIYYSNTLGNNVFTNVCSDDDLFSSSISNESLVNIYYSLEYIGNHQFKDLVPIYEEKIAEYRQNSNVCN